MQGFTIDHRLQPKSVLLQAFPYFYALIECAPIGMACRVQGTFQVEVVSPQLRNADQGIPLTVLCLMRHGLNIISSY